MTETEHSIDELESRYPRLGRETIQAILDSWDQGNDLFLLSSPNHHFGGWDETVGDHSDVFMRYCHQPKRSSPDEIEEMIIHNEQLLAFLTETCDWSEDDSLRPDPESIRRGH